MRLKIVLVVASLAAGPACAAGDGNSLIVQCHRAVAELDAGKRTDTDPDSMYCYGLVKGIYSTIELWQQLAQGFKMCLPHPPPVGGQVIRIVAKWLDEHPKSLAEIDVTLVELALMDAYQCPPAASSPAP